MNNKIKLLRNLIDKSSAILIGAGSGLSEAAGIHFSGKRFTSNFASFIEKYNFTDLYTSSFYNFESSEEKWAYWAKHISINRYDIEGMELYKKLYNLVKDKEHFVITTNVDHQFWKAGFSNERIFAIQGDYGDFQCSMGCHKKTYSNEKIVRDMINGTNNCRIPKSLIPHCPVCGKEMDVNLRKDSYFVETEAWHDSSKRYRDFVKRKSGDGLLLLEFGIGFNTPSIIRYPFEEMVYNDMAVKLVRFNRDNPDGFKETADKTITFTEDINTILDNL